MQKSLLALVIVGLLALGASPAVAGTVASGTVLDISTVPVDFPGPFPLGGSYAIDNTGKVTLNIKLPSCPNSSITLVISCADLALFFGAFETGPATTDATGKFVGSFPGLLAGYQGFCMDPLFIVTDAGSFGDVFAGAFTCLAVNGF